MVNPIINDLSDISERMRPFLERTVSLNPSIEHVGIGFSGDRFLGLEFSRKDFKKLYRFKIKNSI